MKIQTDRNRDSASVPLFAKKYDPEATEGYPWLIEDMPPQSYSLRKQPKMLKPALLRDDIDLDDKRSRKAIFVNSLRRRDQSLSDGEVSDNEDSGDVIAPKKPSKRTHKVNTNISKSAILHFYHGFKKESL